MAYRIPHTVRLPFGFTVRVVQMTRAAMRAEAECDAEDGEPDGLWDVGEMTIFIVASLPITRKRYVLCHELQHAVTDLMHQQLNDGVGRP